MDGHDPNKILCATDLSEAADEAIRQGDEWARLFDASLVVLHAMPTFPGVPMPPELMQQELIERERLSAQLLDTVAERVKSLTGRTAEECQILIEDGPASVAIVHKAEELKADLVVVAGFGETARRRVLLGSVADRVLRYAHSSVLVARPRRGTKRILAATDFSEQSLFAMRIASGIAQRREAELSVVHCLELPLPKPPFPAPVSTPAEYLSHIRASAQARLDRMMAELHVQAKAMIVEEPPGTAVPHIAESLQADLVVLGTTGRTGLKRLLLGSMAEAITRRAPCPVLVVRGDKTQ